MGQESLKLFPQRKGILRGSRLWQIRTGRLFIGTWNLSRDIVLGFGIVYVGLAISATKN